MSTTNRFGLTELATTQAQKEVVHNVAIDIFDAWVQATVTDITHTAPPGSPSKGDSYIVAVGGSGAWSGKDTHLAVYNGVTWDFYIPRTGFYIWNLDDGSYYTYTGSIWETQGAVTSGPYILSLFIVDFIETFVHVFTDAVTFPVNLTNSRAYADTASAGTVTYTIYRKVSPYSSRTNIGSLVFSAGNKVGAFTFGSEITFNASDVLELAGPSSADADMANVAISFKGTRG